MSADEFFVGYLPTPRHLKRFLAIAVICVFVAVTVLAGLLAGMQRDAGDAVWDLSKVVQLEGIVRAVPYPMLETQSPEGRPMTVLLVSEGKIAATARAAVIDGQKVSTRGYLLNRKNLSMLELESSPDAIKPIIEDQASSAPPPASNWKTMSVRGEIVDSKCFLGAMKPGEGKIHKACASLCIRGGVPPMLISFDPTGKQIDHLLVDAKGDTLTGNVLESLLPFVGDPVEVTGEAQPADEMRAFGIFRVGAVRRI